MRIAVPFGFYGWGNIGDESTLQGFARLTAKYRAITQRVWVASRNPSHTARIEPAFRYYDARNRNLRGWLARRLARVYLFAGGTPIMDILGSYPLGDVVPIVKTGFQRGKRIAFVGVGTEGLHRQESRRALAEILAPRVHHWSVRSQRDKDRLVEYRVPADSITVAADMAWLLDPVSSAWGREYLSSLGIDPGRPLVGVNVNNESFMQRETPRLLEHVGQFLDDAIERHDVQPLFICNDVSDGSTYDMAASIAVRNSMRNAKRTFLIPNHYWAPQQVLSLIACCRATISTRYHFCLFSGLQETPFIALQRSDKVQDLCLDLQWPYGIPSRAVSASALVALYGEIERERASWTALLKSGVGSMHQNALKSHAVLDSLLHLADPDF